MSERSTRSSFEPLNEVPVTCARERFAPSKLHPSSFERERSAPARFFPERSRPLTRMSVKSGVKAGRAARHSFHSGVCSSSRCSGFTRRSVSKPVRFVAWPKHRSGVRSACDARSSAGTRSCTSCPGRRAASSAPSRRSPRSSTRSPCPSPCGPAWTASSAGADRKPDTADPLKALDAILADTAPGFFLMKDLTAHLTRPEVVRRLRDAYRALRGQGPVPRPRVAPPRRPRRPPQGDLRPRLRPARRDARSCSSSATSGSGTSARRGSRRPTRRSSRWRSRA